MDFFFKKKGFYLGDKKVNIDFDIMLQLMLQVLFAVYGF